MPRVRDVVRMRIDTLGAAGIDHLSPLEEQATLVWRAMRLYADSHEWKPRPWEGHAGRAGTFTMRQMIRDIFPLADAKETEKIAGLVSQVLKKTYAARCIDAGSPANTTDNRRLPVWWVSDTMPDNVVPVAIATAGRVLSNGHAPHPLTPTRREQRLTPEEAGETMPPAPVTVTKPTDTKTYTSARYVSAEAKWNRLREWFAETGRSYLTTNQAAEVWVTGPANAHLALRKLVADGRLKRRAATDAELEAVGGVSSGRRTYIYLLADQHETPAQYASADDVAIRILEVMEAHGRGINAGGKRGLTTRTGYSDAQVAIALELLVEQGMIFRTGNSQYHLEQNRSRLGRTARHKKEINVTDEQVEATEIYTEPVPQSPAYDEYALAAIKADTEMDPRVRQAFTLIADALADAAVPAAPAGPDQETIERLEALEAEVERLTRVNDGLKQALKFGG